ncbi:hypothetical protein P7K49_007002 [Saguinus oedipus]|uniref:Uncharacterized protein n=1 Tax=Saguinus oedipus TaxID=9490 RepID=A0ABQ9W4V0_SAGOE|nr:hypothetical protein P7K49_007002 [Saguinus oedipus]
MLSSPFLENPPHLKGYFLQEAFLVVFRQPASYAPLPPLPGPSTSSALRTALIRPFTACASAGIVSEPRTAPGATPGGRAHTPQALHQHLGTLGAKANNEKKGPLDCYADPGAPLQQESPSPSPKTSRAADLSEGGAADGH